MLLVILGNALAGADIAIADVGIMILQSLTFFVIAVAAGIKLIPKLLDKIHGLDIQEALKRFFWCDILCVYWNTSQHYGNT